MVGEGVSDEERLRPLKGREAVDGMSGRAGVVMDVIVGHVYLRPIGGGIEWTTPLACITLKEPATTN